MSYSKSEPEEDLLKSIVQGRAPLGCLGPTITAGFDVLLGPTLWTDYPVSPAAGRFGK